MSIEARLSAEKREDTGKGAARRLRASGRVPAVVYGKDAETQSLSVDAHEADHLFQAISVENTIVDLEIDGEKGPVRTLVREIQVHPYRPTLLHIDFYRIQEGVRVEVEIPLHLNGVPEGVKNSGGILQQVIHELPVKCLPTDIPDSIELDVTGLDVGDSVHVSDLDLGEDVEVLLDPERTVCSVVMPKVVVVEEEEEELPEGVEAPEGEAEAEGEEAEEDEEAGRGNEE